MSNNNDNNKYTQHQENDAGDRTPLPSPRDSLRSILHKPELSGWLAKWAVELREHDITYQPRTAIKSQVLADFIADFSAEILPEFEKEALRTSPEQSDLWTLYSDGVSNATGSGLGLVLEVPMGEAIRQSVRYSEMTNNEAEYEAVIAGLKLALKYGVRRVILCCDSQLVVNQVTGTFQIKEHKLQKYQTEIHKLLPEFDECRFDQIPRALNIKADGLAKLVAATRNITKENVVTLPLVNRPSRAQTSNPPMCSLQLKNQIDQYKNQLDQQH
ncbi:uncharacterized protein LOC142181749 [Nicotiana tabacum]|uniref:Uncharacterized protein LOC142181749 n=1 Tax=Nicotiana tabacum TaxID=4097 RepID=A0AC58UPD4_TOBAC